MPPFAKSLTIRRTIRLVFSDSWTCVQTRKLMCQIYFMPATFRCSAYLIGMSAKTLPITAASFEKLFAASAAKPHTRRQGNTLTDWREIAWAALERKKLGDTLRRAIEALSVTHRKCFSCETSRISIQRKPHGFWAFPFEQQDPACVKQGCRCVMRSRRDSSRSPVTDAPAAVIPVRTGFPAIFGSQPCSIRFPSRRQKLLLAWRGAPYWLAARTRGHWPLGSAIHLSKTNWS